MFDPEYHDHEWFANQEVMAGFKEVVRRTLGEDFVLPAVNELAKYKAFNDPVILKQAESLAGFVFWMVHGAAIGCPLLQKLAMLVLSLISTASSCERNWSAYGFVYNRLRNKLSVRRAEDLVYIYQNMRLLAKQEKSKGNVAFVAWDPAEGDDADDEAEEEELEDDVGIGREGSDADSGNEWGAD